MTKKHYEAIARILYAFRKGSRYTESGPLFYAFIEAVSRDLADYFAQDNPKFQRDRFLTACGIETCNNKSQETGTA